MGLRTEGREGGASKGLRLRCASLWLKGLQPYLSPAAKTIRGRTPGTPPPPPGVETPKNASPFDRLPRNASHPTPPTFQPSNLRPALVTLAALMAWVGFGNTVMAEGTEATIPAITREVTALHLRKVGAGRIYALHLPESVRELSLIDNALMALPEDLVPRGIARLWLADNRLTHLPRTARDWAGLEYLNADRNLLSALPDLSRTRLRWLRLTGNRLTTLPPLPATVERLYLADNRLTSVPAKPAALRHLTLAGNPIDTVPPDLGAGLEWLDLSSTQIKALPPDLTSWRTLKVLNLSHCPLPEAEKDRIAAAFDQHDCVVLF